jgi:hypothetical protein
MAFLESLRELKSDFEKIASGGFKLPAWHDPTFFRSEAAAMRSRTAAMRKRRRRDRSAVLPKWVEVFERRAKEYETITTDADGRRWTFEVPGESPKDPYRVKRFCLYAARAAVIVGVVNAGATEDVKVFAWLGQLKVRRPDPRRGDADEITCVIVASLLLLEELANDADIASRQLCAVLAARADQLSRVAISLDARSSAQTAAASQELSKAEPLVSQPPPTVSTNAGGEESQPLVPTDRGALRRLVIDPKLAAKGWSRRKWAVVSNVAPSVVYDFLRGTSKPNAESRASLAGSLGIPIQEFPE